MNPAAGQLDMFAEQEHAEAEARLSATPPCMFDSPARGLAARAAEYEAWKSEWGNFGAGVRSHAWTVQITSPSDPTSRCQATILSCSVRRDRYAAKGLPACDCINDWDALLYRGACTGCDWEATEPHTDENEGVEDAMDHAWPGWRDVPVVPRWPDDNKKQPRWWEHVRPLYPEGWLEQGGPIRTHRQKYGTRHHAGHCHPYHGYDLGVPAPEDQEDK